MTSLAFVLELGARPGLEDVDRELVVELTRGDPVTGGRNPAGCLRVEQPEVGIARVRRRP